MKKKEKKQKRYIDTTENQKKQNPCFKICIYRS